MGWVSKSSIGVIDWFKYTWQWVRLPMLEVFCVIAISLSPLIFVELVKIADNSEAILRSAFWNAIARGQLLLFSLSLAGTLAWHIFSSNNQDRLFLRVIFGTLTFVFVIFICMLFGRDPDFLTNKNEVIIFSSVGIYITFCVFYFFLLVFNAENPDDPGDQMRKGAKELQEAAKGMR